MPGFKLIYISKRGPSAAMSNILYNTNKYIHLSLQGLHMYNIFQSLHARVTFSTYALIYNNHLETQL